MESSSSSTCTTKMISSGYLRHSICADEMPFERKRLVTNLVAESKSSGTFTGGHILLSVSNLEPPEAVLWLQVTADRHRVAMLSPPSGKDHSPPYCEPRAHP